MPCSHCGAVLKGTAKFCARCGAPRQAAALRTEAARMGFSPRIRDPAFARYLKSTNRWAALFSLILAIAAVVGFTIAGEAGTEVENPQAFYIGLAIGAMFLLIAFFQILSRKKSRTWDGIVVDKTVKKKRRWRQAGDDDGYWENYVVYTLLIREDNGKMHEIRTENDETIYEYYPLGCRLRHHAGLNAYEKYDKTGDTFILCAACASLNGMERDTCFRCKCPLLK